MRAKKVNINQEPSINYVNFFFENCRTFLCMKLEKSANLSLPLRRRTWFRDGPSM